MNFTILFYFFISISLSTAFRTCISLAHLFRTAIYMFSILPSFNFSIVCVLFSVVRETLENRGVLSQLRARVRAEVFSALDDPTDSMPIMSRENMLINELIRDYMEYNHYKYSLSVFTSGMHHCIALKTFCFFSTVKYTEVL